MDNKHYTSVPAFSVSRGKEIFDLYPELETISVAIHTPGTYMDNKRGGSIAYVTYIEHFRDIGELVYDCGVVSCQKKGLRYADNIFKCRVESQLLTCGEPSGQFPRDITSDVVFDKVPTSIFGSTVGIVDYMYTSLENKYGGRVSMDQFNRITIRGLAVHIADIRTAGPGILEFNMYRRR